jgi:hypothetical protein
MIKKQAPRKRKNLTPSKQTQETAMYIASVVRNAMEDFHCRHLSDEQMKELNPIIRDAICTALFAYENYPSSIAAQNFVEFNIRLIPGYWEKPKLTASFLECVKYFEEK